MSGQTQPLFDWALWIQWLMATTLGWVLGGILPGALAMVAAGLIIGVLQWAVLRPRLRQAGWWILASAVGWAGGWAMIIATVPLEDDTLTGTLLGAAMGTLQWLVLRRQLHQAGWWVLVSPLGWAVALSGFTGQLLVGAVAGAVTGIALELLLRYPSLMKGQPT